MSAGDLRGEIAGVLKDCRAIYGVDGSVLICLCGWKPTSSAASREEHENHVAIGLVRLLGSREQRPLLVLDNKDDLDAAFQADRSAT